MSTLGNCRCGNRKYIRWHVWYKGLSSPTVPPFPPANIAYNSMCDDCAAREIVEGRDGWPVACIKLVEDQYLPDDDRARQERQNENESARAEVNAHVHQFSRDSNGSGKTTWVQSGCERDTADY